MGLDMGYAAPSVMDGALRRRSKDCTSRDTIFNELSAHLKHQLDQDSKPSKGVSLDLASVALQRASTLWNAAMADTKAAIQMPSSPIPLVKVLETASSSPACASPSSESVSASSTTSSPSSTTAHSPSADLILCDSRETADGVCSLSGASCSRRASTSLRTSMGNGTSTGASNRSHSSTQRTCESHSTDQHHHEKARVSTSIASLLSGAVMATSAIAKPAPMVTSVAGARTAPATAASSAPSVRRCDTTATPFSSVAAAAAAAATGGAKSLPASAAVAGVLLRKAISTPLERASVCTAPLAGDVLELLDRNKGWTSSALELLIPSRLNRPM